jgi:hypothetical protein
MKDAPIAASPRESITFNHIGKWNKILLKWGRSSTTLDINKMKFED